MQSGFRTGRRGRRRQPGKHRHTRHFDPARHQRHSIRLIRYNYTQAGASFITIVTCQRELIFDNPVLCKINASPFARIAAGQTDVSEQPISLSSIRVEIAV